MARVAYLKESMYHDIWFGSGKFIDVYDTKTGFGDEKALCTTLKDGSTGYIPLTLNAIRASKIKTIGTDGQQYSLAVQKKEIYNSIAYCKVVVNTTGKSYTTVGSNYVQISISGIKASEACTVDVKLYDNNNNELTDYKNFIEDDVSMTLFINAYLTFSGSGNGYNFKYNGNELLGTVGTYTNRDINIITKFDNTKASEKNRFIINALTPNTTNSSVVKLTLKKVTINNREIPINT